jgi:hypothetical protein
VNKTAHWKKLRNNAWGIISDAPLKPGDTCDVERRKGGTDHVMVSRVIFEKPGCYIATISRIGYTPPANPVRVVTPDPLNARDNLGPSYDGFDSDVGF